jgi:hypothetical protein
MVASRILLIPVIAAVGYEILRWGAKHRANPLVHAIMLPGIWVQMITTRRPTDDMIEVAIVSLEEALGADGQAVPDGSTPFERSPLEGTAATADAATKTAAGASRPVGTPAVAVLPVDPVTVPPVDPPGEPAAPPARPL